MSDRYQYGEMKDSTVKCIKMKPDVLATMEQHKGKKSWSKFMEELAAMLREKTRHI